MFHAVCTEKLESVGFTVFCAVGPCKRLCFKKKSQIAFMLWKKLLFALDDAHPKHRVCHNHLKQP